MNTKMLPSKNLKFLAPAIRSLVRCCLAGLVAALLTTPAQANFHLWSIREVYTDVSGSLQFIELVDSFGGQTLVGGHSISVANVGNTITHTFTIPANLSVNTFNHALLFGTAGLQAAGGPTPDYIIPNNFLFQAGGTLSFFGGFLGGGGGPYTALPTDGTLSRIWVGGGSSPNSPENLSGQIGSVTVPEPGTLALLGLGFGLLVRTSRKQR